MDTRQIKTLKSYKYCCVRIRIEKGLNFTVSSKGKFWNIRLKLEKGGSSVNFKIPKEIKNSLEKVERFLKLVSSGVDIILFGVRIDFKKIANRYEIDIYFSSIGVYDKNKKQKLPTIFLTKTAGVGNEKAYISSKFFKTKEFTFRLFNNNR